ncbi:HI0074 family nucleotidyltransferase substrate-binding subunit [Nitratifractor sp.]
MNRTQILRQVKAIILKHCRPERIYLFGSRATDEAKPTSDLDIAFDDPECKKLGKIREEVEQLETLLKIDVINLAGVDDRFRNRVFDTGKVLYSATKRLRAEDGLYAFEKALKRFQETLDRKVKLEQEGFGDLYLDLLVKRFEFTYEMAWKALKRYLDYLGLDAASPRGVFREAYAQGILKEEAVWLEMIEMRNLSSHIYDEEEITVMIDEAGRFCAAFEELKRYLEKEIKGAQ